MKRDSNSRRILPSHAFEACSLDRSDIHPHAIWRNKSAHKRNFSIVNHAANINSWRVEAHSRRCALLWTYTHCKSTKAGKFSRKCSTKQPTLGAPNCLRARCAALKQVVAHTKATHPNHGERESAPRATQVHHPADTPHTPKSTLAAQSDP